MLNYDTEHVRKVIEARVPEEMGFPNVILIDTISHCNLKCSMCPHKEMNRKPGIMTWELYTKIIDEIAENKPDARIWITFFGEGMILKDLPEKIEYAKKKGLTDIVLNSNGNLMNKEYSERLIKAGLDGLYVGIDAIKPETYEQIRVQGNLEKVISGVIEYKKMLEEFGHSEQEVIVQFVEMEINKDEVQEFVDFWHSYGITCKVRPMVSWAGKVEAVNLKKELDRLPCYWAMNTINITDTGEVTLCSVDLECRVPMGNVINSSIKEVWNNSLKDFRLKHRNGEWERLPDLCKNCGDWKSGYAEYK